MQVAEWIEDGARLGRLLDPENETVHVYRPGQEVEVMEVPVEVSGDPELLGFVLEVEGLWG